MKLTTKLYSSASPVQNVVPGMVLLKCDCCDDEIVTARAEKTYIVRLRSEKSLSDLCSEHEQTSAEAAIAILSETAIVDVIDAVRNRLKERAVDRARVFNHTAMRLLIVQSLSSRT